MASKAARAMPCTKDANKRLEDEARKMEAKLELLRKTMDTGESKKGSDGSRWKSGASGKPLTRGYDKHVLDKKAGKPRQAPDSGRREKAEPEREAKPEGLFSTFLETHMPEGRAGGYPAKSAGSSSRAAANLQAAVSQQSAESVEVEAFLASLGLDRYSSLFMEHGFDCMEVVQEMQESHMAEIGMATGHQIKLRKRLAEMNPPKETAVSSQATEKRVSFGATETKEATKLPATAASSSGTGTGGSLLDGHYDEAEAAASFQEAVRAWRQENSEPAQSTPKAAPGSFWSSVGGNEVNLERASTPLQPAKELLEPDAKQAETQHGPAPSEEKLCCYQCYKQFYAKYAVERSSPTDGEAKRLCSEACADRWLAAAKKKAEEVQKRQEKLMVMKDLQKSIQDQQCAEAANAMAPEIAAPAPVLAA